MKAKIAKTIIDALRTNAIATGKTLYTWDHEVRGFGALATKSGSVSYFVEYRLGGRTAPNKRMSLGKHGVLTPDHARKLAKERLGEVAKGVDVADLRKEKRTQHEGVTFAQP